jgi:hypothetical protein
MIICKMIARMIGVNLRMTYIAVPPPISVRTRFESTEHRLSLSFLLAIEISGGLGVAAKILAATLLRDKQSVYSTYPHYSITYKTNAYISTSA